MSQYIAIDLGMVHSLNYYTGMIFRGMVKEMGYPICGGGRYDTLVSEYGLDLPATGFALETRQLLIALERQKGLESTPVSDVLFVYNPMEDIDGYEMIQKLRKSGQRVEVYLPDESGMSAEELAEKKGIPKIIQLQAGKVHEKTL